MFISASVPASIGDFVKGTADNTTNITDMNFQPSLSSIYDAADLANSSVKAVNGAFNWDTNIPQDVFTDLLGTAFSDPQDDHDHSQTGSLPAEKDAQDFNFDMIDSSDAIPNFFDGMMLI